jgi:anti-sigma regulatory factor (Ser/Thr protein kinase)
VEHHATLELVPGLRAPHAARSFASENLTAWDVQAQDVEVVQLVVSELVTNALRHAPESQAITLQLLAGEGSVQVRVSDCGRGAPERRSPPDPGTGIESGRGVWIVDAFTDHWGTEPDGHGGKTVWCEIRTERTLKR